MTVTMARTVFHLVSIQATGKGVYKYANVCLSNATTSMDAKILQVLHISKDSLIKKMGCRKIVLLPSDHHSLTITIYKTPI